MSTRFLSSHEFWVGFGVAMAGLVLTLIAPEADWRVNSALGLIHWFGSDLPFTTSTLPIFAIESAIALTLTLGLLVATYNMSWYWLYAGAFGGPALLYIVCLTVYGMNGIVLNPATIVFLPFISLLTAAIIRMIERERQGRQVRSVLRHSVSAPVLQKLAHQPARIPLDGESRKMTFLFAEIRNLSKVLSAYRENPEMQARIVKMVSEVVIAEIKASNGAVDRYLSGGVSGFWNAPVSTQDHEWAACECALGLIEKLDLVNAEIERVSLKMDCPYIPISMNIGINTGPAVIGNLGTDEFPNYSPVGEAVTLAQDLAKSASDYGPAIIIGEHTHHAIHNNFALLEVDRIAMPEGLPPAVAYALLGNPVTKATPAFQAMVNSHTALFDAYKAQNWPKAREILAECKEISGAHPSLYTLYEQRIGHLEHNPPGIGWNGAINHLSN